MDYPLVLVEWIDAAKSSDISWSPDGGNNPWPFLNRTLGYLVFVCQEWLRIATEQVEDMGDHTIGWRDRHAFPREMVRKVTLLETGVEWEWPA